MIHWIPQRFQVVPSDIQALSPTHRPGTCPHGYQVAGNVADQRSTRSFAFSNFAPEEGRRFFFSLTHPTVVFLSPFPSFYPSRSLSVFLSPATPLLSFVVTSFSRFSPGIPYSFDQGHPLKELLAQPR